MWGLQQARHPVPTERDGLYSPVPLGRWWGTGTTVKVCPAELPFAIHRFWFQKGKLIKNLTTNRRAHMADAVRMGPAFGTCYVLCRPNEQPLTSAERFHVRGTA